MKSNGHSNSEYVTLRQLADQIGMNRSNARQYILKASYKPARMRTPDSGGQRALVFTRTQADEIISARLREYGDPVNKISGEPVSDHGFFYVIQLVPELDPRRVKLGFAASVSDRLAQHRTAAPTATCLRSWPCKRTWELPAIDCIAHATCRLILNEVFECDNIEAVIERAESFFALMPAPTGQLIPAECSPLAGRDAPVR